MKVTFYSNFMNHHQLPFSLAMIENKIDYKFVATEPIPQERLNMGYEDMNKKYPFILTTYDSKENEKEAMKLAVDSDFIILGSAPEIYIKERMKYNKITFRYSERIFKKGRWRIINPKVFLSLFLKNTIYRNKNLYLLCSSAYTSLDFSYVGAFKNKAFKWGYFPEVYEYPLNEIINQKRQNNPIKILWCGRFIKWKHPELVVKLAKKLKDNNYDFLIEMIGNGELLENIKKMAIELNVQENINFLGAVQASKVRKYMDNANIFLFTSDFNEGWGAVLNESMNSACAVVASHAIGSVPFLIKDKHNGLIYRNENMESLFNNVEYLIKNKKEREEISKNAYLTLTEEWNAKNAVKKLIQLYTNLNNKEENNILYGICSISKIIKQTKK